MKWQEIENFNLLVIPRAKRRGLLDLKKSSPNSNPQITILTPPTLQVIDIDER